METLQQELTSVAVNPVLLVPSVKSNVELIMVSERIDMKLSQLI
jgi:hypothetical protein